MDWLSLLIPVAYLGILLASLATFSSLYRKRKTAKSLSLSPYFPRHIQRDIYMSLLALSSSDTPSAPRIPDSILRAALLERAREDIARFIEIRTRKPALSTLLQRGVVGDEIWQRLLRAEQEVEAEFKDVVQQANAYAPNWGTTIFQSASEMAANGILRERMAKIAATLPAEQAWWEEKSRSVKEGFMKELNEAEGPVATRKGAEQMPEKVPEKAGSDEDAVLVEVEASAQGGKAEDRGGGAPVGGGGGGGTVKGKKKKGKR